MTNIFMLSSSFTKTNKVMSIIFVNILTRVFVIGNFSRAVYACVANMYMLFLRVFFMLHSHNLHSFKPVYLMTLVYSLAVSEKRQHVDALCS